jgi:hypothetical protein
MVCKARTAFHSEFRALVIKTFQFSRGGEAIETIRLFCRSWAERPKERRLVIMAI